MVARDTSKKVRAAMRVKFNNGEFIAPTAPIGYIIDPERKNRLKIDAETSWIPQKIFELAAHGKGANAIARQLTREQVPTPTWIRYQRFGERASRFEGKPEEVRWQWCLLTVRTILDNEVYIGNTVHYKCRKVSFKSKKNRKTTEDEWLKLENTHEPIISKDLWDLAHAHMDSRKRDAKRDENNVFSGLVYCGECGWSLSSANCKNQPKSFRCTKYSQRGKEVCSIHYTPYKLLYATVLVRLQYWLMEVEQNKDKLLERLLKSGDRQREAERAHYDKELKKAVKRKADVDRLFVKTYEDNAAGRLDDENYEMLRTKYRGEQVQLTEQIEQLEQKLAETTATEENAKKWVELIGKYSQIDELTAPLLNELIDKIIVHEKRKDADGKTVRDIEIYYRFVGKID
jgi:hypothetical protein